MKKRGGILEKSEEIIECFLALQEIYLQISLNVCNLIKQALYVSISNNFKVVGPDRSLDSCNARNTGE